MLQQTDNIYEFADFRLDFTDKTLRRAGGIIPLTPKVFETLLAFIENPGRLIEKDELMQRIWPGRFVEESNLTFNIKMLRKALGDGAHKPQFIETVHGRGYRFIADVRLAGPPEKAVEGSVIDAKPAKSSPSTFHHFSVERRGNVLAVADWVALSGENAILARETEENLRLVRRGLVGRSREITKIENLLRQGDVRLITLTGTGGTGKTVLSQTVAKRCLAEFPDGIFFVELAAVTNPDLLISAVAQMLGVKESGGKSLIDTVKAFLRGRRILLVLDNFEQIIAAAPLVAELLDSSLHLKILVTSRMALRLDTENELVVPTLAVPPADVSDLSLDRLKKYSSVELFVERARTVKPGFVLTSENAPTIARICARLDGLPLAIELAATRVKLLSPPELLHRLENRLEILTTHAEDIPARQKTMRNTIAWSYDLLGETEKSVFRQTSVFSGGFTLDAAEAVCDMSEPPAIAGGLIQQYETLWSSKTDGAVNPPLQPPATAGGSDLLDLLETLESSNLLQQTDESNGQTRLTMLEMIREFAAERLAGNAEQEAEMRSRHFDFYVAKAKRLERELSGANQAVLLNQMEAEIDNFRAAMDWSRKNGDEGELKLAAALTPLFAFRGYLSEGISLLTEALKRCPPSASAARCKALASLGQLIWIRGDYVEAIAMCEESLALARQIDYSIMSARSLFVLGMSYWYKYGDAARSIAYLDESLSLYRDLKFDSGIVFTLVVLAAIYQTNGDLARAERLLKESLLVAEQSKNNLSLSIAKVNMGRLETAKGNLIEAKNLCRESLRLRDELADRWGLVQCLEPLATVALREGLPRKAAKMLGSIDLLLESLGASTPLIFRADHEPNIAATRDALGENAFAASFADGRKLSMNEIVALALDDTADVGRDDFSSSDVFPAITESPSGASQLPLTDGSNGVLEPVETPGSRNVVADYETEAVAKPSSPLTFVRNMSPFRWIASLGIIAVLVTAGIVGFKLWQARSQGSSPAVTQRRLTVGGGTTRAAISGDGRYAAVAQNAALVLFDLQDGGERIVVPAVKDTRIVTIAFRPDATAIYFGKRQIESTFVSLYSVPLSGGEPIKILDDIYGSLSFSPDNKKIAFVRRYPELNEYAMLTADADGSNITRLASSQMPNRFEGSPAWSPDGNKIVCPAVNIDGGFHFTFAVIDAATGAFELVPGQRWTSVNSVGWLPDSRRIVLSGQDETSVTPQIWQVDAPTGTISRVTDDSFVYESINGTTDGRSFVAVKVRQSSHVWILGDPPTQLTSGFDNYDGVGGLVWAADKSIFYHSRANRRDAIWRMRQDGSEARELTPDTVGGFDVSPDGRLLVFQAKQSGDQLGLQLIDLVNGSERSLTQSVTALHPSFSADSKSVAFSLYDKKLSLYEISLSGGQPKVLSDEYRTATAPSVAPSGKFTAFAFNRTQTGNIQAGIAVIASGSKQMIASHLAKITIGSNYEEPTIQWSADETELYFIQLDVPASVSNIMKIKISDGTISNVTNFSDGRIFNFAVEPGGTRIVVARGIIERDASLITIDRTLTAKAKTPKLQTPHSRLSLQPGKVYIRKVAGEL